MYRIFILSLLAIVTCTFALEPSQVILRATEIRGDSMTLEWSAIEGAKTYKVFYDELSLVNLKSPEPILETPNTDKTQTEIQKMMEGTEYYFVVRGFDEGGTEVGKTLPLHASTLRVPIFGLKSTEAKDDQTLVLVFSHPIDIKNTQIEILNTETKKPRSIQEIKLAEDDIRIVYIALEGKIAPNSSHDIVLKKVTNTSGVEMLPEARKTKTFTYTPESAESTEKPQNKESSVEAIVPKEEENKLDPVKKEEVAIDPDTSLDVLQDKAESLGIEQTEALIPIDSTEESEKVPVSIDQLPQTGTPAFLFLFLALVAGLILSYKKQTSL